MVAGGSSRVFRDRSAAGRELGEAVAALEGLIRPIVLALPRGGVPVGFEVARRLNGPLDVLVVRKLGVPGQAELALGAVASGGAVYLNEELIRETGVSAAVVDAIRAREMAEVERRDAGYRGDRSWPDLSDRSVIVVDDGAATGATVLAAASALRQQGPDEVVVALPVAPRETCDRLATAADRIVCLRTPELFWAISLWFLDFEQVTDEEVRRLLEESLQAGVRP